MSSATMDLTMPEEQHCSSLSGGQLVLRYCGVFNQSTVLSLGETYRWGLEATNVPAAVRRKAFIVFVEMTQNIVHYARAVGADGVRIGTVELRTAESGQVTISCSNPVNPEQVDRIRQKLDGVRSLSPEQIRRAYRDQLHDEAHESDEISRGAGLGMLTLARVASAPIDYRIDYPSGKHAYPQFHLSVVIG